MISAEALVANMSPAQIDTLIEQLDVLMDAKAAAAKAAAGKAAAAKAAAGKAAASKAAVGKAVAANVAAANATKAAAAKAAAAKAAGTIWTGKGLSLGLGLGLGALGPVLLATGLGVAGYGAYRFAKSRA